MVEKGPPPPGSPNDYARLAAAHAAGRSYLNLRPSGALSFVDNCAHGHGHFAAGHSPRAGAGQTYQRRCGCRSCGASNSFDQQRLQPPTSLPFNNGGAFTGLNMGGAFRYGVSPLQPLPPRLLHVAPAAKAAPFQLVPGDMLDKSSFGAVMTARRLRLQSKRTSAVSFSAEITFSSVAVPTPSMTQSQQTRAPPAHLLPAYHLPPSPTPRNLSQLRSVGALGAGQHFMIPNGAAHLLSTAARTSASHIASVVSSAAASATAACMSGSLTTPLSSPLAVYERQISTTTGAIKQLEEWIAERSTLVGGSDAATTTTETTANNSAPPISSTTAGHR